VSRVGFSAGWQSGMDRALKPNALGVIVVAWGLAAMVALAEKRASLFGAAERALEGQLFGFILPVALFWLSTRVLSPERLDTSTSPLARFGVSRRAVALGVVSASMLVGAAVAGVAAAVTASVGHDPSAPPVALDAITSAWIGALTASAYAALFAFGATFGARGGGRYLALGFDFILGSTSGIAALLTPRAHALNLLGGEPPLLLSQPTSAALLVVLAAGFTSLAVARLAP
jgi:hypothetical protein